MAASSSTNRDLRRADDTLVALSDDPNVNGQAESLVAGDEDPTRVQIASAAGVPRAEDFCGRDRRSKSSARRRDAALHDHGQEHRHRECRRMSTIRDQIPVNTTYVAGSTTIERHARRGQCRYVGARRRHVGQRAGKPDAGCHACRRIDHAEQRRNDHVRRRRGSERDRWHGDFESGIRQCHDFQHLGLPIRRSANADRERSDARHRGQRTADLPGQARGAPGRSELARHRRSG